MSDWEADSDEEFRAGSRPPAPPLPEWQPAMAPAQGRRSPASPVGGRGRSGATGPWAEDQEKRSARRGSGSQGGCRRLEGSRPFPLHAPRDPWLSGPLEYRPRGPPRDRGLGVPLCFHLDNAMIGTIIGRAGTKIRELEDSSGSKIQVIRGTYEAEVKIFGSNDTQNKAKMLIDDLVKRYGQNYPGDRTEKGSLQHQGFGTSYSTESHRDLVKSGNGPQKSVINWASLRENKAKYEAMKWADLSPIERNFYKESQKIASMPQEEVEKWRKENNNIICDDLKEAQEISVVGQAVNTVEQKVVIIPEEEKRAFTRYFIDTLKPKDKVIIFVGKKLTADDLSSDFSLQGIPVQSLHGNREQCDREQALDDFKKGKVRILIATDLASRGLDVQDITHVFNFDFPRNIEEYVHRVGRTGRAGRTGEAVTLVTRNDWRIASELISILERANQGIVSQTALQHTEHLPEISKEKHPSMGAQSISGCCFFITR
ncbi:N-acetyltransferase ESCO1 [Platysternon megacephalum]|uniref:RNA helicase n=1 Tax=Platysternon megacephalum TaxID=55544 RepID=A0A4D9EQ03_9SAUR|nr:N-acetyltransferase ESCO1 [Platysternon megacephalum]